nr:hypothetical protein CJLB15_00110 [Campylobacter phage CJLB-15]
MAYQFFFFLQYSIIYHLFLYQLILSHHRFVITLLAVFFDNLLIMYLLAYRAGIQLNIYLTVRTLIPGYNIN